LGDAKRPLRFAFVRLAVAGALGYVCALVLPPYVGVRPEWGAAGLTASAGVAGWIEFALLRASLNRRIGPTGLVAAYTTRLWMAALVAAAAGWGAKLTLPPLAPLLRGGVILPAFGVAFVAAAMSLGIPALRLI